MSSRRLRIRRLMFAAAGLTAGLVMCFSLVGPTQGARRAASPCPAAATNLSQLTVEQVRATMTCVVNFERTARGLPALDVDPRLQTAAQKHADDMAARGYVDHYNPEGQSPRQRTEAEGYVHYNWHDENLVQGTGSVHEAMHYLIGSLKQCRAMFFPIHLDMGSGFARGGQGALFVQEFSREDGAQEPFSEDYGPYESCPQTLRGEYGAGGEPANAAPRTRIVTARVAKFVGPGEKATAKFRFASSERGSRFKCRLDGRRFAKCVSPKTYRVGAGRHVFTVRAIDAAGKPDPTPAKWVFRVSRRP